jgi:hypothetical protein
MVSLDEYVSPLTGIPARAKGKDNRKNLSHKWGLGRSNLLFESRQLPDGCALRNFIFLYDLNEENRYECKCRGRIAHVRRPVSKQIMWKQEDVGGPL